MKTIVKLITGSRLYGTNTPESDTDLMSIVIFPPADIVMGKRQNSQNKNGLDDKKIFDLKSFFEHLKDGQTWAVETLFAPTDCTPVCTPLWNLLVRNRQLFISKDIHAFVGFARGQAQKYSDKGFRLQSTQYALKFLEAFPIHSTLDDHREAVTRFVENLHPDVKEHIQITRVGERTCDEYFEVCGAKYQMTQQMKVVVPSLAKAEREFGARSRQASAANGKDWKALSHAARVAIEATEILMTGRISFPLASADFLRNVKLGLISQRQVDDALDSLLLAVDQAKSKSRLPSEPNYGRIDKLLSDILIQAVIDHDRFSQQWLYPVRSINESET